MRKLEKYQCPRCGGAIPNVKQIGEYPGALSRLDNMTEVCSACGTDEAFARMPIERRGVPVQRHLRGTLPAGDYVRLDDLKAALGWYAYQPENIEV